MKIIGYIIQKEFTQIFRNKVMLPLIFVMPIMQLLILVFAATMEMKEIKIFIIDHDQSALSNHLYEKFEASPFFTVTGSDYSDKKGLDIIQHSDEHLILTIPQNFEKNLYQRSSSKLQISINAINGLVAGLANSYTSSVIMDYTKEVNSQIKKVPSDIAINTISTEYSFWFNPTLNFKFYMLPGILVILVSIVGMFLSAINLVREKEMGTIEQVNVTPIKKYHFIIGKLVPFWVIALFELTLGLAIGKLFFHIPMEGNLIVLFLFAGVYLIAMLGLGLLISTLANTQQQVMFIAFFFMLMFILMSGLFTPVESMPQWAQKLDLINPFYYFMRVIRMILLKGSSFADVLKEFIAMAIYGIVMLSLAIWRYRKVS